MTLCVHAQVTGLPKRSGRYASELLLKWCQISNPTSPNPLDIWLTLEPKESFKWTLVRFAAADLLPTLQAVTQSPVYKLGVRIVSRPSRLQDCCVSSEHPVLACLGQ